MICSFVLSHFQTKLMQIFSEKSQKHQNWPLFGQNLAKTFFFWKSGFVTFFQLFFPNTLEKIRKTLWWEVWELASLTHWLTDWLTQLRDQNHRTLPQAGVQKAKSFWKLYKFYKYWSGVRPFRPLISK